MIENITLKQARNLNGFSREYVAEQLKVNVSSIINWESGKSTLNAKAFMMLCKLYGVSPDAIILL